MDDVPTVAGQHFMSVPDLMALAPSALVERLRALASDFRLAYAPNTLRTCGSDWRIWRAFCEHESWPVAPATVDSLRAFLNDRIEAGRKRGTLDHYVATLSLVHRLLQLPWPLDTMEGRLMWRAVRRDPRIKARRRQAKGLTRENLHQVLATLSDTDVRDVRDAVLLSVAYETMCRRSELVALRLEHVTREDDGSGRVLLERSKTDQEGEGAMLYLSRQTMQRLDRWRELAGFQSGPLFRSVPHIPKRSRSAIGSDAFPNPLCDGDVARIFKRRAMAAGLEDASMISGHSTRVGPTQDMLAKNFSGAAIMKQGRWTSERMVIRYGERVAAGQSAMAQLIHAENESEHKE